MRCRYCAITLVTLSKAVTGYTVLFCPKCHKYYEKAGKGIMSYTKEIPQSKEEISCKDCVYFLGNGEELICTKWGVKVIEKGSCALAEHKQDRETLSVSGEQSDIYLSPNAPIVTNEQGGMQSHIPYAFHLLDANATMAVARVFGEGAERYERDNWRKISCEEHINHALTHLFAALGGDKQDEHLEHAGARLIMAIATQGDGSLEARPECTPNPSA